MDDSKIKAKPIIWILFSLVLSLLALSSGLVDIGSLSVPDTWTRDFLILLSISTASSLGLIALKRMPLKLLLLTIRFVTLLLIGVPFGDKLSAEFYLLTALIIDISFALPFRFAIAAMIITLSAELVTQVDISAYYFKTDVPSRLDYLAFAAWGVVFGTFSLYVNYLNKRYRQKTAESDHRRQIVEELIGANRGYLEYASSVEQKTSDKERKRIITELHDVVGQSFTNILAITDMAEKHPPKADELTDVFSVVKSQARYGLEETRVVLYKLHTFKPTGPTGLQEFHRLITVFSKSTQLKVDVNWANLPWDIGENLNDIIYKVIRESLINSFRHGKATHISIHFRVDNKVLHIDIIDNGTGSKSINKGIGLNSMEERVTGANGHIKFTSSERDFSVHVQLPIQASN